MLQKGEVVDDGNSVIVVERYYNLNFNPANIEQLKELMKKIRRLQGILDVYRVNK